MNRFRLAAFGAAALFASTATPLAAKPAQQAENCAALTGRPLANGKIEAAALLTTGATVDTGPGMPGLPASAPFCRVQAVLTPVPSSSIKVEVWLPERAAWNGKLMGAGNGGFGANLGIPALLMRGAVSRGYAAVGSDMGHFGKSDVDASWALNAPEKIKDYGWRANHLAAQAAKQVIAAYYAAPLAASYFHGCSDGGRQALIEARRFPEDYDAIIAGAPAIPWTRMASAFASNSLALSRPGAALGAAQLKLLQTASLAKCDKLDGVADGVIGNPRQCRFDPAELQCKAGEADCLTAAQVEAARHLYQGPKTPDGKSFYPGFAPGAEAAEGTWAMWLTAADSQHAKFSTQFFRYFVHADPEWPLSRFDLVRDYALAKARVGSELDADDPDLGAFFRRGGRLLMYHGWQDAAIPPENTIGYYERVRAANPAARERTRLFMAPGMSHCLAGPGPNVFDALGTLDAWHQGGPAPERIVATKFDNDLFGYLGFPAKAQRTRPLCAWPKVARWDGKGSTDAAVSFTCVAPGT
ncbi:tannase/feruloyl esterase family alpha/beta hydrolase [Sphingomonas sp. BT-65]|uniref:tannase/feruloyl esterase family alpha/beta hydrolase n=1 Tax=Sphingomonas sp. BT-65 TaxID=2989821 RepID=UPI0022355F28|nr:tannase/feruloyl esterase family alpha/beta hydrolase [Sphingomonas sp. BT-65]MCW4461994.1 tannase/feruloyl esterase family alpha/beta hydrolase [Sphingomonas sp. BT-65]